MHWKELPGLAQGEDHSFSRKKDDSEPGQKSRIFPPTKEGEEEKFDFRVPRRFWKGPSPKGRKEGPSEAPPARQTFTSPSGGLEGEKKKPVWILGSPSCRALARHEKRGLMPQGIEVRRRGSRL